MFTFESDYVEGCHEKILAKLTKTNMEQLHGYGNDPYCDSAKKKILAACGLQNGSVAFLSGGTQTNQIIIDAFLRSYEGVLSAQSSHINCHEAGAIEFGGHKVLALDEHEGKMDAEELNAYLEHFYGDANHEHMVFPGMVYITYPTEYGTLYSLSELRAIRQVCDKWKLPLFLDGARLGYGLAANPEVTLKDIASICDVFYIGGTKCGALIGEAVVFTRDNEPAHFQTIVKQHGAMLAKGRLIGIQFDVLFTDDLYTSICKHAIDLALKLKKELVKKGYQLYIDSMTNQQFVVLDNAMMEELGKKVGFGFWETVDDSHTAVRFAMSWATTDEAVSELLSLL